MNTEQTNSQFGENCPQFQIEGYPFSCSIIAIEEDRYEHDAEEIKRIPAGRYARVDIGYPISGLNAKETGGIYYSILRYLQHQKTMWPVEKGALIDMNK